MISSRQALTDAGLRVTAARLAVLDVVAEQPHLAAPAVVGQAQQRLGAVSVQAVYDVLHALTDAGLLRRIQPAGSPARYETRVVDNHHHLVCRECGTTVDVDCAIGAAPCLTPSSTAGFEVDEAEVIWWGRCPDCRAASAAPSTPA